MDYKRPRKPIRWQKECISAHNLQVKKWLVYGETDFYLKIVNVDTGSKTSIDKFRRERLR